MRKILLFSLIMLLAPPAFAQKEDWQVFGPNPRLASPEPSLVPTVNVAKAVGWAEGQKPVAAKGLAVNAFAKDLDHPRWIYVLPNNDVLVAETNRPPKDDEGIKEWLMGQAQNRAGAGVESANRITLLRDTDGDGVAELKTSFLENLYSPFGMALIGDTFYVANANSIVKFPYKEGQTNISTKGKKLVDLPAGINHHWTKNILASKDGSKLYASVGSNSNIGENGMEAEKNRAAIFEVDVKSGKTRLFASGLRNPVGMDWNPVTGELWTAVNERDELGKNLVPDYMTSVKDGGFYGWPYSYFGQNVDERVEPQRPDLVEKALEPDYALGAHTASLGLAFYTGDLMPQFKNGALIGQHGSWNRNPRSGYKLIYVPFRNGKPSGMPVDILSSFVSDKDEAYGRPVGVTIDKKGAILMADDVGNVIWRMVPAEAKRN
jgi:glucose/arabinose dehydrogenase